MKKSLLVVGMKRKIIAEISDITKTFGGLVALSDIDLNIKGGEIFGLIGPNGAGKTTLFNILTGMYKPTKGFFKLEDVELTSLPPHSIVKAGLAHFSKHTLIWDHDRFRKCYGGMSRPYQHWCCWGYFKA